MRQDLGADVAAQVRPQANLLLTGLDGVFEMVDGHVHGVCLS
jgi:aryl carrier-like protein